MSKPYEIILAIAIYVGISLMLVACYMWSAILGMFVTGLAIVGWVVSAVILEVFNDIKKERQQ